MTEVLFAIYFPVFLILVVGSWLFFRGRDPAFKQRWHRRVAAFNTLVIGGMILEVRNKSG